MLDKYLSLKETRLRRLAKRLVKINREAVDQTASTLTNIKFNPQTFKVWLRS